MKLTTRETNGYEVVANLILHSPSTIIFSRLLASNNYFDLIIDGRFKTRAQLSQRKGVMPKSQLSPWAEFGFMFGELKHGEHGNASLTEVWGHSP